MKHKVLQPGLTGQDLKEHKAKVLKEHKAKVLKEMNEFINQINAEYEKNMIHIQADSLPRMKIPK